MSDTLAEQETHFRWDNDARRLEAWTADPRVARRWTRRGLPVEVLGRAADGAPRTWEVRLPWPGRKGAWVRAFSAAVPSWETETPEAVADRAVDAPI